MSYSYPPPDRIAVAYHPNLPKAEAAAGEVCQFLKHRTIAAYVCSSLYDARLRDQLGSGGYNLLIALGGDGTMLRAGRLCAPFKVPVLGINAGSFGFLTELQNHNWAESLPLLLEGKFRLEHRMMLRAELWRKGQCLDGWDVLNEVVVTRGKYVRPVLLRANVDGYRLASYMADGLIAATPTGSTAYALAAGGPIMPPELRNILIIPVAPHLSIDRAIILPEGVRVTIEVVTSHEVVLSVDGHPPVLMKDGDTIDAFTGTHTASFVRFQDPSYFYRNLTAYMEQNPTTGEKNG
ncbi:MAG TPA: NAD(+)/NADH kinase [Levilinea sp.]|nr:NAD(+)/NADH kinase [Levilinea sp.]